MPRKVVTDVSPPSSDKLCCFCGLGDDNELQYGKFHEYNGILTHYYCLLLSSNMQQKGRDDEGILGFLPEDINKELKRGKRLACCYCKKTGATLGCCNTKCKKIFHFPCGLKSGSLHQFFGEFRSYCKNHRPKQKIDDRVSEEVKKRDDMICYICYDDVSPIDIYGTLWAPCCKKNAWFHRTCVQQLAMSAGYFFKCPLCNNKADFQRAMLDHGIFIPSQDASWELVPNAFEELLYRHNRCDADDCLCPKGREHTSSNAKWELTLCRTCGSQGIHMACGNLKWVKPIWECTECTSILNKTLLSDSESSELVLGDGSRSTQRRSLRNDENSMDDDDDDDESSDSDISVGTETMETTALDSPHRKTQADEPPDSPPALRITRRSVIPIPKSPVNTKTPTPKATRNEHLPPEPKRPRYSDHVIQRNRRESIDSDDDIVVISGPSTSENSNGRKSPPIEYSSLKKESEEPKKCEKTAYVALDKFEMPQQTSMTTTTIRVPTDSEKRVVEIDLSEAEYAIPESRSKPIVNDAPELNFMITNVTSLAPEAFENVEEQKMETLKQDLTNVPQMSRTSIFNESNGGLTPQTPIVLDDEPLPVAPSNRVAANNNLHFPSMEIHDQIKIIRFDSPMDVDGKPTNTVLYGITIPGTNQTVPLIFAPAECNTNLNSTSSETNASDSNPSNENQPGNNSSNFSPANFIAGLNGLRPLENHKIPSASALIRSSNEQATNVAKSKPSSLSLSVPLKAIVNERFSTARPHRKSHDNNAGGNKTIIVSNQTSLDQAFGNPFSSKNPLEPQPQPVESKNSVAKVQPIAPKKPIAPTTSTALQVHSIQIPSSSLVKFAGAPIFPKPPPLKDSTNPISNFGSSKQALSNVQANENSSPSSSIDAATISKMFALLPRDPSSTAKANSPLSNGIISSSTTTTTTTTTTTSRTVPNIPKQNKPTTATVNSILPDVNTTWLHSSGSVIKIHTDPAETDVTLQPANQPNLTSSTRLDIENSADNKQQISAPQLFQLIRTDADNYSNDDCDGDAGSGPAVQPASVDTSTNTKHRHVTERHTGSDKPLQVGKENTHDRRTFIAKCDADTLNTAERSASSDRSDTCNPTGLIYKTINLRDLKFSLCESNIIKMAVYDTYTVNIKLDSLNPCKNSKYSSCRRRIESWLDREAETRNTERDDVNDVPNSLNFRSSGIGSNNKSNNGLNQTDSTSQHFVESVTTPLLDLPSSIDVASRGQDELKENLDPIPLSTNSSQNCTNVVDRKNKFRVRSGVDNSMRSLNEKEGQQMINEKNDDTPKKVTPHDSQSLENHSKVLYNGWKDSACHEETNFQNVLLDRSVEIVSKNVLPRSLVNDNDNDNDNNAAAAATAAAEDSDLFCASKRKRISANDDDDNLGVIQKFVKITTTKEQLSTDCNNGNIKQHLVKDAKILQRKSKLSDNVSRVRKINVNNTIYIRKEESLSCKVSIDLARIRSVLAAKFNCRDNKIVDCNVNVQNVAASVATIFHCNDAESVVTNLYKFPSFDNLTSHHSDEDTSLAELRKSKSLENLCSVFSRSCVNDNIAENRMQGYKRKRRSFEEHDCVR